MNKKAIIWIVVAAVVLFVGYLVVSSIKPTNVTPTGSPSGVPAAGGKSAGVAPTSGGSVLVSIKGFSFVSNAVKVVPGTTIIWKNFDNVSHQVLGGDFKSKVLAPGGSYSHQFTKEGTYVYYCGIHNNMSGEIVVKNSNF